MAYLTREMLDALNFKHLGKNVRISDKASLYNTENIEIGDHSRIDDFCVLSGKISLGRNVHLAVYSHLAGGKDGIEMHDFSGLAYGCQIFAQSDDYSGKTMTNPTVPSQYKNEKIAKVIIGKHCILGTNTVVVPGVHIGEGTSVGAMAMVTKSTQEWSIYVGAPARRVKARSQDLLMLEKQYLEAEKSA